MSKDDKVYTYSDIPFSMDAIVTKRLDKGKMQVKVIDGVGLYKKGDEVIVKYESVSIRQSTDEKIRNIKIEDFDFIPMENDKVLITYWDKQIKEEDGKRIIVSDGVSMKNDKVIGEILKKIKEKVNKISITYTRGGKENEKTLKIIENREQIGEFLEKVNKEYATWQMADYDSSNEGYLFRIFQQENEIGSVRFSQAGVCELVIKEQLPWDMNCYEIEQSLYQWIQNLYQSIQE